MCQTTMQRCHLVADTSWSLFRDPFTLQSDLTAYLFWYFFFIQNKGIRFEIQALHYALGKG